LQVENNNRAVYDAVAIITDYIEMKKDTQRFAEFRSEKFGSANEISNFGSRIIKFFKNRYLQLKKVLDY
jgi:hypothetical protein